MDLNHPSARLLVEACNREGLLRNQTAYVLSTAYHETGAFKYMREIWGPTPAQKRYEGRKDLGNVVRGDGRRFMGRGFVQITGRRNYTDWSKRLGLDLLKEPQLAEQPAIAAQIIVKGMKFGTFTGKCLDDYVTLRDSDFRGARRIVNGTDRADLIADYAKKFDAMLAEVGYGVETDAPAPSEPPKPQPAPAPKPALPIDPGTVVVLPPDNTPNLPVRNRFLAMLIDALSVLANLFRKEK